MYVVKVILPWYKNEFLEWKEAKRLFQILPFYNVSIKKPKIKSLKNIDLLHELPFYDELNIRQISDAFGWYARSYKVEIVDSNNPGGIEIAPFYFNSITNTVRALKYDLDKSFQEILYKIDN